MSVPKIDGYRFGEIIIDERRYSSDVIIYPDRVEGDWWRKEGHNLVPEDLFEVFQASPDVLIVGQGSVGRMEVSVETQKRLKATGIEIIADKTDRACETYNRLREQRRVVAALHLTC